MGQGGKGRDSLFHLIRDHAAPCLDLLDKLAPLLDLLQDELDRDVQDMALGTSLARKTGNEGSHLIETVANRLSAFLLCCSILASSCSVGWILWF